MRVVPGAIAVIVVGVLGVLAWLDLCSRTDGLRRRFDSCARGLHGRRSNRRSGRSRQGERCQTRRISCARRRLSGLPYRAGRAGRTREAWRSRCRSARSIRPISPPTRKQGSATTATQEFLDAVRRGVRKDGARLYPAMPFTSYTYLTDADALAIKAYLFSLAGRPRGEPDQHAGIPVQPALVDGASGHWHSIRISALHPTAQESPNGTAAPISPRRWRIAANATRRAILLSRSTTGRSSRAR